MAKKRKIDVRTVLGRQRALASVDRLLSQAQDVLGHLLYHGASSDFPTTHLVANEVYDQLEKVRWSLRRRRAR